MKSLLNKKRLPGILAAGLVALAVGAAGAPASAAPSATSPSATSSGATTSALTAAQQAAKKRELRRCSKLRPARKAQACKRRVTAKYNELASAPPPIGRTYNVDLGDNFFAPTSVALKVNDAINWSWATVGGFEPHNVSLAPPYPAGVTKNDFTSPLTAVPTFRFRRQFTKPGNYSFVCELHFEMTMNVNVTK
jgi:plastocyanin